MKCTKENASKRVFEEEEKRRSGEGLDKAANVTWRNTDPSLSYERENEDKKCTDDFCEIWYILGVLIQKY